MKKLEFWGTLFSLISINLQERLLEALQLNNKSIYDI